MARFDEEKAKERLTALDYHPVVAEMALTGIANIHDDLQSHLDAWLDGVETPFEFKGVSLVEIMEKEGRDYLNALFTMSLFIDDPAMIQTFREVPPEVFHRRCGGITVDS